MVARVMDSKPVVNISPLVDIAELARTLLGPRKVKEVRDQLAAIQGKSNGKAVPLCQD